MDKIILDYLNKNYRVSLNELSDYTLIDRAGDSIRLITVIQSLSVIFAVDEETLFSVVDKWCETQAIMLNNRVVEMQERLYKVGLNIRVLY